MTIKTISYDQNEILRWILELNHLNTFEVDLTYGNGGFYKEIPQPQHRLDMDSTLENLTMVCSSIDTLFEESSIGSVMFDPPFLTYIKQGRQHGSIMGRRFSGYWSYSELEDHYRGTLEECSIILKKKGVMVFKCQDIVHNHKLHATHVNVINWAEEYGLRLKHMFILNAKHRIPVGGNRKQKNPRQYHSYFLVLEKI